MLRCPETHEEAFLVMSTGEMVGRMVRSGILGCPICRREYAIVRGVVNFSGPGTGEGLRRGQKWSSPVDGPRRRVGAHVHPAHQHLIGLLGDAALEDPKGRHPNWLHGPLG